MKHLNSEEKDAANIKTIRNEKWLEYYKELWTNKNENEIDEDYDENRPAEIDQSFWQNLSSSIFSSKLSTNEVIASIVDLPPRNPY